MSSTLTVRMEGLNQITVSAKCYELIEVWRSLSLLNSVVVSRDIGTRNVT